MLSFAAPIALGLLALAIPIIGLYFLKIKLRRVPVSTNMFWKQVYEERPPRSLWQQLRHWISLAVQLLLLALLTLAVSDPFLPWQKQQAKRISLVIDTSASMGASDGNSTRLQTAKDQAIAMLSSLRDLDEVAVIEANNRVSVAIGMTNHIPSLRRTISELQLTDSSTELAPAIELAKRLVGEHEHGQVLVFSDGMSREQLGFEAISNVDSAAKENAASNVSAQQTISTSTQSVPIHWNRVGKPMGNIGITQFQARRSLVDVTGYELLIAVFNASEDAVEAKIELLLNDHAIDVLPIKLAPGEKWKRSLEKTSQEGGHILAQLTDIQSSPTQSSSVAGRSKRPTAAEINGITVDDQAQAYLPGKKNQRVLIVSPGNLFLRKAFEANPLVHVDVTTQWNPTSQETESPTIPAPYDLFVFHGTVPDKLPSGNVFVIDPEQDTDAWSIHGEIDEPIVTRQNDDSPLMRNLRLDNVVVPKAKKLVFNHPVASLASTVTDDSIFTELKRDDGRCIVLCVDLESSDLAFRTAFPILVTNALQWFGGESDAFLPALKTGALHAVDLAKRDTASKGRTSMEDYVLISPSGDEQKIASPMPAKGGPAKGEPATAAIPANNVQATAGNAIAPSDDRILVGPLQKTGLWQLKPASGSAQSDSESELAPESSEYIAVNLADERETDLSTTGDLVEAGQLTIDETPLLAGASWFSRPLWFYIALAAGLLCIVEWYMYQRRVIS